MSLETARLYADLQDAEALARRPPEGAQPHGQLRLARDEWRTCSGRKRASGSSAMTRGTTPTLDVMLARVHPNDVMFVRLVFDRARARQAGASTSNIGC